MNVCPATSPVNRLPCTLDVREHRDSPDAHLNYDVKGKVRASWRETVPSERYLPAEGNPPDLQPDADGWLYGVAWRDGDALVVSGPRTLDEAFEAVHVMRESPVALGQRDTPDPDAAWLVRARPLDWQRVPETNGETA